MKTKPITVGQLAREAGVDIDEVLVTAWDIGASKVLRESDKIPARFVSTARTKLGIATQRDFRDIRYWRDLLGKSTTEIRVILQGMGHELSDDKRRIPKAAIRPLKTYARKEGIDPLTGVIKSPRTIKPQTRSRATVSVSVPSFTNLGSKADLRLLESADIRKIHYALVADFAKSNDPINPPGVRDEHLLESAVFRPHTALGSHMKYPTVETSAAALLCSLIHDHPFHNGNKRTALVAMLVFMDHNGSVLTCDQDDLFRFVLRIAQHRIGYGDTPYAPDNETYAVAECLVGWSRLVTKYERPMTFLKLRPILGKYDCVITTKSGRANIVREVPKSASRGSLRRLWHRKELRTQVYYADDGRDVPVNTMRKIRKDLRLNEEHGIDSTDFYSKTADQVDDFIVKYRKTLRRLARM